jgi:hypothetical protein
MSCVVLVHASIKMQSLVRCISDLLKHSHRLEMVLPQYICTICNIFYTEFKFKHDTMINTMINTMK